MNIFFPNKKELNILNIQSIEKYINKIKPKYVLHAAGLSRPINIHDKDISKSIDLNIIGYQALAPIQLTEEITSFDEIINVSNTLGFPNSYGILKINNEIITYTGKTATSFIGCVRGFSAISALEQNGNP